jgi:hypothetical protein
MLLIAPGWALCASSNASRSQHKCSWCSVMAVVQHTTQWIRAHPEQYLVLVVAVTGGDLVIVRALMI